jgi:hypothetical protein
MSFLQFINLPTLTPKSNKEKRSLSPQAALCQMKKSCPENPLQPLANENGVTNQTVTEEPLEMTSDFKEEPLEMISSDFKVESLEMTSDFKEEPLEMISDFKEEPTDEELDNDFHPVDEIKIEESPIKEELDSFYLE